MKDKSSQTNSEIQKGKFCLKYTSSFFGGGGEYLSKELTQLKMSPLEKRHQHLSVKSSFLTNKAVLRTPCMLPLTFGLHHLSMDAELSCSTSRHSEDDDEDGVP